MQSPVTSGTWTTYYSTKSGKSYLGQSVTDGTTYHGTKSVCHIWDRVSSMKQHTKALNQPSHLGHAVTDGTTYYSTKSVRHIWDRVSLMVQHTEALSLSVTSGTECHR